MIDESRIGIYDYLYNLLYGVVSNNVYQMREPQELTQSDTTDGFIVIRVGEINDASEFTGETYAWARCYIEVFVPPMSRGRLNHAKYSAFESAINSVIQSEAQRSDGTYSIDERNVLSVDDMESSNANNSYHTFIKSFLVITDNREN